MRESQSHFELDSSLDIRLTRRWPSSFSAGTETVIHSWPLPVRPRLNREPLFSIIVVTCNALVFTKLCLATLFANTDEPHELILIDNGSSDGSPDFLRALTQVNEHVVAILNDENAGFAAATNQGLERASTDILILLNSDTMVPPGWVKDLTRHLESPKVGLVSPVTNRSGNECEIDVDYTSYGEFLAVAEKTGRLNRGESISLQMLSMFCLAMRRDVYATLGNLDVRYGTGLFEDDDYSLRSLQAGYTNLCAEDCYVHHFGQASFSQLGSGAAQYRDLLRRNQQHFEKKWHREWRPRQLRETKEYRALKRRIANVTKQLPSQSVVLFVSRGDEELLQLSGVQAAHFPQDDSGAYAGYYPEDTLQCIQHLESLRRKGAEYLFFPSTALWWLEYYEGLGQHLESTGQKVSDQPATGVLYKLGPSELGSSS